MIEIGQILYFVPPYFADGQMNNTKRIMLVVEVDTKDNVLTLVNLSKIYDKNPRIFLFTHNLRLKHNTPFSVATFAKLDGAYKVELFNGIDKYLYGVKPHKLNSTDIQLIINERTKQLQSGNVREVFIDKHDFMKSNT